MEMGTWGVKLDTETEIVDDITDVLAELELTPTQWLAVWDQLNKETRHND